MLLYYGLIINKQPNIRLGQKALPNLGKEDQSVALFQPFYQLLPPAHYYYCPFQGTSLTITTTSFFRGSQLPPRVNTNNDDDKLSAAQDDLPGCLPARYCRCRPIEKLWIIVCKIKKKYGKLFTKYLKRANCAANMLKTEKS